MTFAQPFLLWAFALLPLLVALFFQNERKRRGLVTKLVAARLLDRLAGTVSIAKRRWRFVLVLLAMAGLIVSLAQPRYGFTWQESKRRGRDVIIAIDTSKSMLATDLAPNRLTRAKLAAQDLINELHGDRVGVIAFAGGAFLQAPLTADYGAVLASLQELDTEMVVHIVSSLFPGEQQQSDREQESDRNQYQNTVVHSFPGRDHPLGWSR